MAQIIQLYKDEAGFIKYYEENLLNKTTTTFDKIRTAGDFLGRAFDVSCPTCAKNAWQELLTIYNQLKTKQINEIYTKYQEEELKQFSTEEIVVPKKSSIKKDSK